MYFQINDYMENVFSLLLCGFRKFHSTQDALFGILHKWQKELDSSDFIETTYHRPITNSP